MMAAVRVSGFDFEGLVTTQRRPLEALARRLVWDAEEAKDLVQAAMVQAWQRRDSLHDAAAAPGWLRRIVVHRAMSHLRRRRLWQGLARVLLVEPEAVETTGDDVERSQHHRRLAVALEELSTKQRAAFSLRYLEGLSLDEVADAMGIDRGTVRVHVQRAVKALRLRGALPEREQEP